MLKHIRFDIFELQETKVPVRLINTTNERRLVHGHETPLRVKWDIEDVSSELENGGQGKSYKCTFETGICPFLNNVKDNKENWKIGRGRLNKADTGPSVDHTLGTGSGSYLFVNVSSAKTNPVSLQTVVVQNTFCVRFFYHMYGANIGDLTVRTQSASSPKDTVKYFTRSRTQGDRWKEAFFSVMPSGTMKLKGYRPVQDILDVPISPRFINSRLIVNSLNSLRLSRQILFNSLLTNGCTSQVLFTAKHGVASKTRGDIALDDIELIPGKCSNDKDALKLCSFDDSDCGYTTTQQSSLQWTWKSETKSKSFLLNLIQSDMQPTVDHTLGTEIVISWGCGSPVVKVSDHGRHVMSSSPVSLKTLRVGVRCALNLSRAETSSRWCGS
ncbi:MAM and LDL-receptor class A domain-containing protein 1 [Trichonephila clavipes]|nr:MAM and LDL-receptor class A domain-containing protein 1 [Trichonephila clavipes]